ncbi:MAG: hypothetical protein JJ931_04655 [Henriciella sp.]|nr:hypothetical protein [Henriciella sp.]MBO6694692.1 hypothetical protein [Henriciella sp.]
MKLWLNMSLVITLALFATHEMDAITHAEWKLLPILSGMEDALARNVFVLLHIPLFAGAFWAVFLAPWRRRAAQILSALTVLHAIVHFALSDHALYTFTAPVETITVYGAAVSAAAYLFLSKKETSE